MDIKKRIDVLTNHVCFVVYPYAGFFSGCSWIEQCLLYYMKAGGRWMTSRGFRREKLVKLRQAVVKFRTGFKLANERYSSHTPFHWMHVKQLQTCVEIISWKNRLGLVKEKMVLKEDFPLCPTKLLCSLCDMPYHSNLLLFRWCWFYSLSKQSFPGRLSNIFTMAI